MAKKTTSGKTKTTTKKTTTSTSKSAASKSKATKAADINKDGKVDEQDLSIVHKEYSKEKKSTTTKKAGSRGTSSKKSTTGKTASTKKSTAKKTSPAKKTTATTKAKTSAKPAKKTATKPTPKRRTSGTDMNGNPYTDSVVLKVWKKAEEVAGQDPDEWRKDGFSRLIRRGDHGNRNSKFGWEVDHIKPVKDGGTDALSNLQPLQWENNKIKKDDFPWNKDQHFNRVRAARAKRRKS